MPRPRNTVDGVAGGPRCYKCNKRLHVIDSRTLVGAVTGPVIYRVRECKCGLRSIWKEFRLGETSFRQAVSAAKSLQRAAARAGLLTKSVTR